MHTIDFAVEEAIFRRQQDIHKWTTPRWLQERRELRARRMARLIKENGEHTVSESCPIFRAEAAERGGSKGREGMKHS